MGLWTRATGINSIILGCGDISSSTPVENSHHNSLMVTFNGNSTSPGLFIDGLNRVGIGTSSLSFGSKCIIKSTTSDHITSALNVVNNSDSPLLYVRSDGRVGIGTTDPTALLDVTGNTSSDTHINFLNTGTGNVGFELRSSGAAVQYIDFANNSTDNTGAGIPDYRNRIISSNNGLTFNTNSVSNVLFLQNSGNIGIGKDNPQAKLDVEGWGRFGNNNGHVEVGFNTVHAIIDSDQDLLINYYSKKDIYASGKFFANDVEISGNVGIGKAVDANFELDVCGIIRTKHIRVQATGCDFVFADDYSLMSLAERKQIIQKNRFLPNVKPALDMQKNGADLGETTMGILQNVEEHERYLYQHEDKFENIEKRLNLLEKKMKC